MFILIKLAYRSVTLPHLGQTDHLSLLLFSTYTSPRRSLMPEDTLTSITGHLLEDVARDTTNKLQKQQQQHFEHWSLTGWGDEPIFACFEVYRSVPASPHVFDTLTHTLTLWGHDVRHVPRSSNPRKASGSDGVPKKYSSPGSLESLPGSSTYSCHRPASFLFQNSLAPQTSTTTGQWHSLLLWRNEKLVLHHIRANLPPPLIPVSLQG